jgi:hypothetical protein
MENDQAPLCRIGTSGQRGKLLASPIADLIRIKCSSEIIQVCDATYGRNRCPNRYRKTRP